MLALQTIEKILELKQSGYSSRKIAALLNIGKSTVNDTFNRYKDCLDSDEPEKVTSGFKKAPRIMFFDLESTPSIVAAFKRWKVNIGPEAVIREGGYLLSACWKFLGDEEVTRIVLTPDQAREGNDLSIVIALFEAFEKADIVIGHNAKKFDVPLFKTRLIANGIPPHKTVKVVDTLEIAKKLRFNSNKLDSLGNYLQVGRKIETTGISLWLNCMSGDVKALNTMVDYNAQDVILLEQVYLKLRAFDTSAPNLGHFFNDYQEHCPVCGSTHVEETGNSVYTSVSEFAEVLCNDCGHRSRKRKSLTSTEKKNKLLTTAR